MRIQEATQEVATNLGIIMPYLKPSHEGGEVDGDILRSACESPSAVVIAATINEHDDPEAWDVAKQYPFVGCAVVSTLHGLLGEKAWLEDFVVTPEARKYKTAQKIWDAMTEWRIEKGLYQMRFNSAEDRASAHGFYKKNGCEELAQGLTTLFVHNIASNS